LTDELGTTRITGRPEAPSRINFFERFDMTKILSALLLTAFAFSAQAASHAGGAPMKADAPAAAASTPKKAHKAKKVKTEKAAEMKKEEAKK
jgi:hypothetical protein